MPFAPTRALVAAAATVWAGAAAAEPAPPYHALLARAEVSPSLAEAEANVTAAEGRLRQAQTLRNPELSLEVENFAGEGPFEDFGAAETTLGIGQTLELGGKRKARSVAAREGVGVARARRDLARADYASRLAVLYAEAEAAAARVSLAEELLGAAETDARTARLLVENGKEAPVRALQADSDVAGARADAAEARATAAEAFGRLSALTGEGAAFDSVAESLLSRPASTLSGVRSVVRTPAVIAAEAERAEAAAEVQVERSRAAPDVTVSAGVRRFAADDSTALVAGVSLPLPVFDRNRGATDAARAQLRAAEARLRQAELEAQADLRAADSQARAAAERLEAALAGEGAASEGYRLSRIGYEGGKLSLLELTTARRALSQARIRTLEARLALVRAEAEAARLTGRTPFGA